MKARWLWLSLGYAATACGILGIVLPLVPTTPFLLVAVFAFARSSPRLHHWLTTHPQLGVFIDNWQRFGAISWRSKLSAVLVMALALLGSWWFDVDQWLIALQALTMVGVCAFILSRPNGPGIE
jgi:uncharacterized protein